MVHEEDHVRVQAIRGGLAHDECVEEAAQWAAALGRRLPLAHDDRHGYLTASLSNTGTGMRLSFLLHLAALAVTPALSEAMAAARSMGCAVRGAFGEGTPGTGAFVQVSNRCTYGAGASNAIARTVAAARHLVVREREARADMLATPHGRSDLTAAFEGARDRLFEEDLPGAEALRAISVVRLGVALRATTGDLLRTGEWMASAGVVAWSEREGEATSFERMRRWAAIRAGLRA
jgi:protein arginine kinase